MTSLSIQSLRRLEVPAEAIWVITDAPEFFAEAGVRAQPVSAASLRAWRGKFDFVHRAKLEAMLLVKNQVRDRSIVFVDSDTFWIERLPEIDRPVMQACDRQFPEKTLARYRAALAKGGFYPNQTIPMYNAGLIGLPAEFPAEGLQTALKVTDWLSRQCPAKMEWAEQFAISNELASRGPIATWENGILHYWFQSFEFVRVTEGLADDEFARLSLEEVRAYLVQAKAFASSPENLKLLRRKKMARSIRKRINEVRAVYLTMTGA